MEERLKAFGLRRSYWQREDDLDVGLTRTMT